MDEARGWLFWFHPDECGEKRRERELECLEIGLQTGITLTLMATVEILKTPRVHNAHTPCE